MYYDNLMNGAPASLIVYSGFRKLLASCFLLSGWSIVVSSYFLLPSQVWLLFWCGHYSYLSCMCLKENPDFFTFSSFLSSGSISWNLAHFSWILVIQGWQYFFPVTMLFLSFTVSVLEWFLTTSSAALFPLLFTISAHVTLLAFWGVLCLGKLWRWA